MMKKIFRSPVTAAVLFLLAAGLLITGTIGGVRAAPLITDENDYLASMELSSINLAITENGTAVSGDALFSERQEDFKIGKKYPDEIAVANTGAINSYVRVTVTKYWTDSEGKAVDLDPGLILLTFAEGSGWEIDENASTEERTVLYYSDVVPAGASTSSLIEAVAVSGKVQTAVSADKTYDYDGTVFHVDIVADGVQEHNAEEAMTSAWGRTN